MRCVAMKSRSTLDKNERLLVPRFNQEQSRHIQSSPFGTQS